MLLSLSILNAAFGDIPRVWTSASGMKTPAVFEESVKDCLAHGVEVMESHARDQKTCAEHLAICRRHGMKLQISVNDASKADWQAKKTGRYELAVMSGGCYKGLAIDRNLFSFTAARHEIVVEPPVYSKGQAYAKHPHYYMLGDGHYFGGYVPTGRAEVVVPERLFDGKQHLRIVPAKVETAPSGAVPENDSAADILDTNEIRNRRLVKLSFDLTGCEGCRLDKVGIAVYWHMDDKDPKWRPERTCYSVFSPITRERMRESVRNTLSAWTEANGGKFPSDVVVGLRLGDEIFNATGWVNCPAASFPLWDYSASAIAAFRAASPSGVEPPRTWGAPEVYGADACAQFLYLFHKACAEYLKTAVEEAHAASPDLLTFRNTTRGDAWSYGNDHDGTGQELLAQVLDMIHLDPYPVNKGGYGKNCIPGDMAYLSGLARRYKKPIIPWMQAHQFPSGGLIHPVPSDIERMWGQMKPFAPDAIMWLGYKPAGNENTFPLGNPASWEAAGKMHEDLKSMPQPTRKRPTLAIVRPYSARSVVCKTGKGYVHPADVILREFANAWSCDLGQQYDVFEIPPYETDEIRTKRDAELKCYAHVVSSVDWPGAMNVARDCSDKVLSLADIGRKRAEFRRLGEKWFRDSLSIADDANRIHGALREQPLASLVWTRQICPSKDRYIGWPTVCRRQNGELIAVFSGDRIGHVCPYGKTQMVRSSDDGETWSDPETIHNSAVDDRDAGIIELADGTLVVNWFSSITYSQVVNTKGYTGVKGGTTPELIAEYQKHFRAIPKDALIRDVGYFSMRSTDGGRTWEKPVRMIGSVPHGGIQLKSGRLLTIGRYQNGAGNVVKGWDDPRLALGKRALTVEKSDDGARSWQLLTTIVPNDPYKLEQFHEPHLVELDDGTIIVQFRHHAAGGDQRKRTTLQCESRDGGKTWTPFHPTGILGYPTHLMKLRDGRLLATYACRIPGRIGEWAAVSADGGKTWDAAHEIRLAVGISDDCGYPSTVQLSDGSLLTVYYQRFRPEENPSLMATKWRLKD